jgi:excisionase family DNA binding protein
MQIKTRNSNLFEREKHSLPKHALLPRVGAICSSLRGFDLVPGEEAAQPGPEAWAAEERAGVSVGSRLADYELLTVTDIAAFLHVPKSWVYERTRRRGAERLPHIKVGKYLRFRLHEIERYLETLRRC